MFTGYLNAIRNKSPLVHNITNYVTVNDCANILLAIGASPIMADDKNEAAEITSISNALVINIGTLNERTIESMILAGRKANELNIPVILDPVGAGASKFRTETAYRLLETIKFCVIRGNLSEIKALNSGSCSTKGVDASNNDQINESTLESIIEFAKSFSKKVDCIAAITGAMDIISNGVENYTIYNGNSHMSKITGTGCMLTSLIGGFCGANPEKLMDATVNAVCAMGICGEQALEKMIAENSGTASLKVHLIDCISKLNEDQLKAGAKIEFQ